MGINDIVNVIRIKFSHWMCHCSGWCQICRWGTWDEPRVLMTEIIDLASSAGWFDHYHWYLIKHCAIFSWWHILTDDDINIKIMTFHFFSRKHGHWSSILKSFSNIFGSHQLAVWFSIILKSGFILHNPWAIIWFCLWPELD